MTEKENRKFLREQDFDALIEMFVVENIHNIPQLRVVEKVLCGEKDYEELYNKKDKTKAEDIAMFVKTLMMMVDWYGGEKIGGKIIRKEE